MTKKWCRHIVWLSDFGWILNSHPGDWPCVTRSWKVCPICQAPRPTRANIKAAKLMNTQDFEAFRMELRQAAIDYAGLMDLEYDEDSYVNAVTRLEVAAEKFAEAKQRTPTECRTLTDLLPPPQIVKAAATVCMWMEINGYKNWQLGGLCDRRYAENARQPKPPSACCEPESIS